MSRRERERDLERELGELEAPDESAAEQRAWRRDPCRPRRAHADPLQPAAPATPASRSPSAWSRLRSD